MYFSSKQEPGLNLHLSNDRELSSGCQLHIARVITRVCVREMEKQWEVRKRSHFQYRSHSASPCVSPPLFYELLERGSLGTGLLKKQCCYGVRRYQETKQKPWGVINNMQSLWTFIHLE